MDRFSLRQRIFLLFLAVAAGALISLVSGLLLGFRRAGGDVDGYLVAGVVAGFGILGIVSAVWLLFDDNVAKPITRIAADLRARAHSNVSPQIDGRSARYLGDLGPAASAVCARLGGDTIATAERIAEETASLAHERARLADALSELPVAVLMVSAHHEITLYDGQAASALGEKAPLCLGHSLFDYLEPEPILAVTGQAQDDGRFQTELTVSTVDGAKVFPATLKSLGPGAGYMLVLPVDPDRDLSRPLVFNFDFLEGQSRVADASARLDALTFVVFDLETTGLRPDKDEVVQIGAVRIVNRRRVEGEVFDTLVNPGRPIPKGSTEVHGITDEMVRDAPAMTDATARFRQFIKNAVLVAHNAPFDLAFLKREAERSGAGIANPVLDTVLLSAVLYGPEATHTLDAIAERMGVDLRAEDRHTALGDAVATAEVLQKMIPVLQARGMETLGDALAAMERHAHILKAART